MLAFKRRHLYAFPRLGVENADTATVEAVVREDRKYRGNPKLHGRVFVRPPRKVGERALGIHDFLDDFVAGCPKSRS
jgi:hypothetical protein